MPSDRHAESHFGTFDRHAALTGPPLYLARALELTPGAQ